MGKRGFRMRGAEVAGGGVGGLKLASVLLGAVVFVDVAANVVLFLAVNGWCGPGASACPTTARSLWHAVKEGFLSPRHATLDLTVLAAARVVVLLVALALTLRIRVSPPSERRRRGGPTANARSTSTSVNSADDDDGADVGDAESQPLLSDANGHAAVGINGDGNGSAGAAGGVQHRVVNPRHKTMIVAAVFVALTAIQGYVGVKCVSFDFPTTLTAVLMCTTVVWINAELFLTKNVVDILTRDKAVEAPALHHHPLYYVPKVPLHSCDVCGDKCRGEAYRCRKCDFDVCGRCFAKADLSKREKVVRGDKGVKEVKAVDTTSYVGRAAGFAAPHWLYIAAAVSCLLATSAINLWLPKLNGEIIDTIVDNNRGRFASVIRLFVALSAAYGFLRAAWQFLFRVVGAKMAVGIRDKLFGQVIKQDVAYFDQARTGDLISRLSGDVSALVQPIQNMIGTLTSSSIQLVGGVFMCFHTCWRLSMLAFVTVAPIMYLTDQYARWSRRLMYEYWEALGEANAKASEALGNVRTVKAFSTEWLELRAYVASTGDALRKNLTDALGSAATTLLTTYLDLGGTVLILWYGGDLTIAGDVTVGTLVAFRLYWSMINSNYKSLMDVLNSFTRAGGAAQRVISLLDAVPDIDLDTGERHVPRGSVALDNVFFHYQMRAGNKVLKGVSLELKRGDVCALVGRSGGGKSTIVHLLMRFYDPCVDECACEAPLDRARCGPRHRRCAGRVLIDGRDLRDLNLRTVHEHIGLVAQETQLFNGTIRDNIAYGLGDRIKSGDITDADIVAAARDANAHDFISEFEDGYATKVGEKGVRLSGGQKQRIALARVFLRRPALLFLDEATSSLDAESESLVQEALDRLIARGDSTVLLIAHRLSTVINADKIAVIDQGRIAEQGTHAQLVDKGGIYASLVSRQMERHRNVLDSDAAGGAAGAAVGKGSAADDDIDALLGVAEAAAPGPQQQ